MVLAAATLAADPAEAAAEAGCRAPAADPFPLPPLTGSLVARNAASCSGDGSAIGCGGGGGSCFCTLTRKMVDQEANVALAPARAAYDQAKAPAAVTVQVAPMDSDVPKMIERWLQSQE